MLKRPVARRRFVGRGGVRAQCPLKFLHPADQRLILAMKQQQISTNGPRCHPPVSLREHRRAFWANRSRGESVEIQRLGVPSGVGAFVHFQYTAQIAQKYKEKRRAKPVSSKKLFRLLQNPPPSGYPCDQLPNTYFNHLIKLITFLSCAHIYLNLE